MTYKHRILVIALCFLHITVAAGEIRANLGKPLEKSSRDVYYVIVASGHYLHHTPLTPTDIDGAMNSALRMKEIFKAIGATDDNGIVLSSTPQRPITRSDITKALNDMSKKIIADHARNPLALFYFIGHGTGDSEGRTLFLLPGDIKLENQGVSESKDLQYLRDKSLTSVYIPLYLSGKGPDYGSNFEKLLDSWGDMDKVTRVSKEHQLESSTRTKPRKDPSHSEAPTSARNNPLYLLLFDVCYQGVEPKTIKKTVADPLISGLNEKQSAAIRHYQKGHAGEPMVDPSKSFETFRLGLLGIGLYGGYLIESVAPGTKAPVVEDPRIPDSDFSSNDTTLGPLARRMTLIFDEHKGRKEVLTFRMLIDRLTDGHFDSGKTPPAHVLSTQSSEIGRTLPEKTKRRTAEWNEAVLYAP